MGIDVGLAAAHSARKLLFKPAAVLREIDSGTSFPQESAGAGTVGPDPMQNKPAFPNELEYGIKQTSSGTFGLLRIRSFDVSDYMAFVHEVARILQILPPNGLIIDVRANPGGNILAGEHLLQLLTDRRIDPEPVCLRNTTGTLAFTNNEHLSVWRPSIDLAVETGLTIRNISRYRIRQASIR
jgi:hypothetical protein